MSKLLSLERGHYLGKIVDICYADGIIAGATTYPKEVFTSQMHYHDNLHISFVLQGGSVEKRIGNEYERLPGNIMFYHAGEPHQNIQKAFAIQKLKFYKLQKINITLSYLLLVTIVILFSKLFNGKDITNSKYFWTFSITIGYIFLLFFSKFVTKFYKNTLTKTEELLQELQP